MGKIIYNIYRGPWVPKEQERDLVLASCRRWIKKTNRVYKKGELWVPNR